MPSELEVLGIVSDRLSAAGISFMLTGSFALAFYATPRMTRDLDFVVALKARDVATLIAAFASDFYVDHDSAASAVAAERLFNLMHLESGIKVDFIVQKSTEYRQVEFARRKQVSLGGFTTWIVSCEDLILSKLVWARESASEMQRRDIALLLAQSPDLEYIRLWAPRLGVGAILDGIKP